MKTVTFQPKAVTRFSMLYQNVESELFMLSKHTVLISNKLCATLCRYQFDQLPSPPGMTPGPLIFSAKIPAPRTAFQCKTPAPGSKKRSKNCRALRQLNFSAQMTVLTLFMLMQMPGPRDIIIYWPGPQAFLLCKSPGVPGGDGNRSN